MAPGTKKETTTACPDCGSSKIGRVVRAEHNWWCRECGARFLMAVRRPVQSHQQGGLKGTLAGKLDQLDPDSLGGDA